MSDNELGAFLRGRREAVTPAEVGLPVGARRRTPGLRRSELATLAGLSVEYLTRLEQGRDRHPSPAVLRALGTALRLSGEEAMHLRMLAKVAAGGACTGGGEPPSRSVRPTIEAVLRQLEPAPAAVVNRVSEVLAYTTGFARLAEPVGLLDSRPPHLVRFIFTDSRARSTFPDWGHVADQQVAQLRTYAVWDSGHIGALAEELTAAAGSAFADRWRAAPVPPTRTGVQRWVHPEVGQLRLAYELMELPGVDEQKLLVYLPADDATSAELDRLSGRRPGALHAVG